MVCISLKFILFFYISSSIVLSSDEGSTCKTKSNEDGVCKKYGECPSLGEKLKNKEIGRQDIVFCTSYGTICCPSDVLIRIPETPARANVGEISRRKCKEFEKITQIQNRVGITVLNPDGNLVITSKCKHNSIPLIIGGVKAGRYEFPHQALLGYNTAKGVQWACGGSLVSSNYVLTAAHCNYQSTYRDIKFVKLGMLDRMQNDDEVYNYKVIEKIIHPHYDRRTYNNDIALLKLDRDVDFTEFIYPICLPTRQHDEPKAVVTGFGTTGKTHALSVDLLKVVLEQFSHEECKRKIQGREIDKATMMCYGERLENKDACRGDSGGPIQVSNNNESLCTYKLIGVVSFGASDCGTPGVPGIFVNVFNYLSWIEEIIWKDEH